MSLPSSFLPAPPSFQTWGVPDPSPDLSADPRDAESDLGGDSSIDEAAPPRSGTPWADIPLTGSARNALRERARLQSAQTRAAPPAPTPDSLAQAAKQQEQALEFQFAMAHLNRMTQLVQQAMTMLNGPFMPMGGAMSLMPAPWTPSCPPSSMAWPTWSPYGVGSPVPVDLGEVPHFSPYFSPCSPPYFSPYLPVQPFQTWSGTDALEAGLLTAGAMGAGLLASGVMAHTVGHAIGSTFGCALGGLTFGFGW